MGPPDYSVLRSRLLRAGVAPRFVARTLRELDDHHADLRDAALRAGDAAETAQARASDRLGDPAAIAEAILARPELRSRAARWPWAVYGLGPSLLFVATTLMVLLLCGAGLIWLDPAPAWVRPLVDALFAFVSWALPPLLAIAVLVMALRRHASAAWPLAGAAGVAAVGAALTLSVRWSSAVDGQGALELTLRYGFGEALLAAAMLLPLIGFVLLRGRREPARTEH